MKPAALDYSIQGYVPIGVTLSWDVDRQEQIGLPTGWRNTTLETSKQYFSRENNGIAILTGERSAVSNAIGLKCLKPNRLESLILEARRKHLATLFSIKLSKAHSARF